MTDNTRSRAFRQLLAEREMKHLTTKPYRPRTNEKAETLNVEAASLIEQPPAIASTSFLRPRVRA